MRTSSVGVPLLALRIAALVIVAHIPLALGCYQSSAPGDPVAVTARLLRLLDDPAAEVRRTAALSLGKIGRPEAAPGLIARLADDDALVRQYAAWALGNLSGVERLSTQGLVAVLDDPVPEVRAAAGQTLGQFEPTPALLLALTQAMKTSTQARLAALQALGWLDAKAAYPALVTAVQDPHAEVRQAAIAALGELGEARAVPFLIQRLTTDSDAGVRSEAAFRLGKLAGPEALPALEEAMRDPNPSVRRWAAAAAQAIAETEEPGSATTASPT